MDETYDFGVFRIDVAYKGRAGPTVTLEAYESVVTAAGVRSASVSYLTGHTPVRAALDHVKKLRRALRLGPRRYAGVVTTEERRSWREAPDLAAEGEALHAAASIIGDEPLAAAEAELGEELARKLGEGMEARVRGVEAFKRGMDRAYDLGPLRVRVEIVGMGENVVAFRIVGEAPGVEPFRGDVASPNPVFADAAIWFVRELAEAVRLGPEEYTRKELLENPEMPPEKVRTTAAGFHALAAAAGAPALEAALISLRAASAGEAAEYEGELINQLEEERREVREKIERLRRRRT
jgi:hypothetical protein